MLKRPKSDGRCIHCREKLVKKTMDHVFPSSWYPDSTAGTVQRWTAPSCKSCNGKLGKMERDLFVALSLCINPQKAAAAGISQRAIRSLGIRATGLSDEEMQHRKTLKDKIFEDAKLYSSDDDAHLLPGLGPHPEAPAEKQVRITFPADDLIAVVKKIVRGSEYWLANGRIIEPPYEIDVLFPSEIPQDVRQVMAPFGAVYLGPGFRVRRGGEPGDAGAALYEIVVWDSLTIYAAILPPEADGTPTQQKA